jgi:hypothetical protein
MTQHTNEQAQAPGTYDYIVVGGGAAGSVVAGDHDLNAARRLSTH